MSDEAKVRELFAGSTSRPTDLDGRHFKVDRERAVATILQAGRAADRSPARRNRWLAGSALVLAAAAGALIWQSGAKPPTAAPELLLSDVRGSVVRRDASNGQVLGAGERPTPIPRTGELATGAGSSAHLRTPDGLSLEIFEQSRVTLPGLGQGSSRSVALLAGSIRCDVPHLGTGNQFAVTTPDATVIVRGTAFSVIVSGVAEAARTCVKVERGLVLVKSHDAESLVGAGQSWGCASPEPVPSAASAPPASVPPRATAAVMPAKAPERSGREPRLEGTLEEQNRLFQAGLAAERLGDTQAARAALEALLSRYPASPLAADARLALTRVRRKAQTPP